MSLFWGCVFSSFAGPATLPSGAVAWLKAENNANDSSGNTNNGVVDGLVTYAAGEVGNPSEEEPKRSNAQKINCPNY